MKSIIIITSIMLFAFIGQTQSNYEIISTGDEYSEQQITDAFGSANFCGFFFINNRNIIVLNDGSIIELMSSAESDQITVECSRVDEYIFPDAVWSISESGKVVRKLSYSPIK